MTLGVVDAEDYDFWKAHFGEMAGTGAGSAGASPSRAAVPEPATAFLLALGLLVAPILRRRRSTSPNC